jgi:hypothetical protein
MRSEWEWGEIDMITRSAKVGLTAVLLVVCMVTSSLVFLADASDNKGTDTGSADSGELKAKTGAKLTITGLPGLTDIGKSLGFTLSVLTKKGDLSKNYKGTIEFWSSDPSAVVPSPFTFSHSDKGQHTFNGSLIFYTAGMQTLTATDVRDPRLFGSATIEVIDTQIVLLNERFDSFGSLDPHWTIWNCQHPVYNSIDVSGGALRMTGTDAWYVDDGYNSMANWTYPITYGAGLTISFRVYLPHNDEYKEGFYGQFVAVVLLDGAGTPRLVTRFLMDIWEGAPSGFTYVSQENSWSKITGFAQGWHNCSFSLQAGSSTWTATFDGVTYPGLTFATEPWLASDLSKVVLVNALREEPDVACIDDFKIEKTGPTPPPSEGWSTPVSIGLGASPEWFGSVAVESNQGGYAVAAWAQSFNQGYSAGVMANRYVPGAGWQGPEYLGMAQYSTAVKVGVDDSGNLTVAWIFNDSICSVRYTNADRAWGPVSVLSQAGDWPHDLTLAVEGSGKAVMAWVAFENSTRVIRASIRNVGNVWSAPVRIESRMGDARDPSAAITAGGDAFVVFTVTNGSFESLCANVYISFPGYWLGDTVLFDRAYYSYFPKISMDLYGNAFVVWDYYDGYSDAPYASVFRKGWGWGQPVRLDPLSANLATYPDVSTYGNCNAVASWTIRSVDQTVVRSCEYVNGSGWQMPVTLGSGLAVSFATSVSSNPQGISYVAWSQSDSIGNFTGVDVNVVTHNWTVGWSLPTTVGRATNASSLDVSAGPDDVAFLVWDDGGYINDVWASVHGTAVNALPVASIYCNVSGLTVEADGSNSYDPDGTIFWYSFTWGDGNPPTPPSALPYASHTYASAGSYLIRLQVIDNLGGSGFAYAAVNVSSSEPGGPVVFTAIYDMFQQPWGDWWAWRYPAYRTDIVLSNVSGQNTLLYNPDARGNQGIIYAPYRMNVSAFDLTNLNVGNPEFMPVLGSANVSGCSAEVNLYFNYLDQSWWDSYWVPRWSGSAGWPTADIMAGQKVDGWYLGVVYQVNLNRAAAEKWLGMPQGVDAASWWANNSENYRDAWTNWLMNEGNNRLDIFSGYEYPMIGFGTMMDMSVGYGGAITLNIGHISWGYEILMTRWLSEAQICSHEPYYEDFRLDAHYADDVSQWVAYDSVCQYSLHAVRANETLNGSAWAWEPNAIDYVSSSWTGHPSRYDPYEIHTYTSWNAGDPMFGQEVRYENTPTWFNLGDNSRLVFILPTGNNVIGYMGTGVPADAIRRIILYKDYSAYNNITIHGSMTLGHYVVSSNMSGGPDLSSMYDPVSNTLTIDGPLSFDNVRFPDGALYHGAPWIEFNVGGPVTPDAPPVANAGPDQFANGQDPIFFNASGSSDDHGIVQYLWTWVAGNGSAKSLSGMMASCPAVWFFSYGNYTITLTVTDTAGQTATDTFWIDFGFRIESSFPKAATGCNATMIGYYRMILENHGLTSMRIQVLDVILPGPSVYVYDWTVTFPNASSPQTIITEPVWFNAGHYYQIEMTPHGTNGTYVVLYDFFVKVHNISTPAINVLRKSSIAGGFKIEFTAPTSVVEWGNLTVRLSDGSNWVEWSNISTAALTSATPPANWQTGSLTLGSLRVSLNVTDLAANGVMSNGDYITLTLPFGGAFSPSTTYTLTLIYEPTAGQMLNYTFTG